MKRRAFVKTLGAGSAGLIAGFAQAQALPRYNILIKNGEIRDPGQGFRGRLDVAILDGRIAAIERDIAAERALDVIDARGLYVTPGLIDLHTHCFWGGSGIGIEPDPVAARSGTSTWVDAGSFAYSLVDGFRRFTVQRSQARIFGYIYLYPSNRNPDVDPVQYVRSMMRRTGEAATANRDIILGIKFQVGSNMNGKYSLEFLKIARELCDQFHLPLMAHISFAPPETQEVMDLMRSGDVVTHCYNGHTLGIVDQDGKIKPGVQEARARGVLFDVGHGLGSFNFPAARKALAAGFPPDTISTDLYSLNVKGPVYDLPTTLSKLMFLGMSFDDVLERATRAPAQVINRVEGLGGIRVGAPADLALLAIEEGEFQLMDSQKNSVTAKQRIVSRLTICRGKRLQAPL
ncbi:MAG: amidohydrolase/deacetylase family metallohydrolase [Acidobacteriota bacterium]